MLSRLQNDYQRLEQSLQRLTDSIAVYNPSVAAADELVAVDKDIVKDVDILARHQANHVKLEELRKTTASLDQTIKKTVQLLAETRRQIKAVPAYQKSEEEKSLPIDLVRDYGKYISRTSIPPTRLQTQAVVKPAVEEDVKPVITNGVLVASPQANRDTTADVESIGVQALDIQTKQKLDPFKEHPFQSWVPYEMLQSGVLGDIQRMLDAGKDPASVLSAEEQAEADKLKAEQDERNRLEQEEAERRRMSIYQGGGRAAPQQDVFDPDEA